jgi:hypothetical protein
MDAQKFGEKKVCVITGTSSGLGRKTAKALLKTGYYYYEIVCNNNNNINEKLLKLLGKWHVIGACRDVDKMAAVAEEDGFGIIIIIIIIIIFFLFFSVNYNKIPLLKYLFLLLLFCYYYFYNNN